MLPGMNAPKLVHDALGLAARCRDTAGLRRYLEAQQVPVLAVGAVVLVVGLACGAGIALFLATLRTWLTLPALVLGSLAVIASVLVQLYAFFAWLEDRALAQALGRRRGPPPGPAVRWINSTFKVDIGAPPALPWPVATGVVAFPLLLLAIAAPLAALLVIVLAVAAPLAYAAAERQTEELREP
jgi:hypothetical protein